MKEKNAYQVKAIWKTLQGEGLFAGRPAVFVRLVGCNMWSGYSNTRERDAERTGAYCPRWCDTDFTKEGSQTYTATDLVTAMCGVADDIRFCVITGGEPLLQVNIPLIKAMHNQGFFVAIETNGTVPLKDNCWDEEQQKLVPPDWIVCSPKLGGHELQLEFFDELKLVVPDYLPDRFKDFAARQRINKINDHLLPLLWLQPEDGLRLGEAKQLAINLALSNPSWRVSVQTHKVLAID